MSVSNTRSDIFLSLYFVHSENVESLRIYDEHRTLVYYLLFTFKHEKCIHVKQSKVYGFEGYILAYPVSRFRLILSNALGNV